MPTSDRPEPDDPFRAFERDLARVERRFWRRAELLLWAVLVIVLVTWIAFLGLAGWGVVRLVFRFT